MTRTGQTRGEKTAQQVLKVQSFHPCFGMTTITGNSEKKKETNIFCFAVNERLSQVWMASDSFCESLWISKREKHIFPIYKLRREISPSSSSTLPKISLWKSPEEFIYIYKRGSCVCVGFFFFSFGLLPGFYHPLSLFLSPFLSHQVIRRAQAIWLHDQQKTLLLLSIPATNENMLEI